MNKTDTHKVVYRQQWRKYVVRSISKRDKTKFTIDAEFVGTEQDCINKANELNNALRKAS